jgi:hypothetical protein
MALYLEISKCGVTVNVDRSRSRGPAGYDFQDETFVHVITDQAGVITGYLRENNISVKDIVLGSGAHKPN